MWLDFSDHAEQNDSPVAGWSLQPGEASAGKKHAAPALLLVGHSFPLLPHTLGFPTAFNQTPVEKGTQ